MEQTNKKEREKEGKNNEKEHTLEMLNYINKYVNCSIVADNVMNNKFSIHFFSVTIFFSPRSPYSIVFNLSILISTHTLYNTVFDDSIDFFSSLSTVVIYCMKIPTSCNFILPEKKSRF